MNPTVFISSKLLAVALAAGISSLSAAPAQASGYSNGDCGTFTVAVIPDTQNYADYRHQKWSGFPFDGIEQYYGQMQYIAANARSNGGDIVFATHVGDLWQHYSEWMDPEHEARGFKWKPNLLGSDVARSPKVHVRGYEIPAVAQGFGLIQGRLPFSVVPGNHDYDALWTDPAQPSSVDPETGKVTNGVRHVGGLSGYKTVFSDQSVFFKDQPWYVGSHDDGADSAQVFAAGGCRFLHIGLQYHAPDSALEWAADIIAQHPGLPTIVTTHDYLDRNGERNVRSNPQNSVLDPEDNSPEMIWDGFISRHDQVFMVLSGHIGGQGYSVDRNRNGREVHQVMADYQSRGQTIKDAGGTGSLGDGWMRLLDFDLDGPQPQVRVRTYSTHYGKHAHEIPEYASWYKSREGQAQVVDADFLARDEFIIPLADFKQRFSDQTAE
ncbi:MULTISPECIES: hypothetical protein [unclassified Luteimonas]